MSEAVAQPPFTAGDLEDLPHDYYARDAVRDQVAAIREYIAGNKTVLQCSRELTATVARGIAISSVANEDSDSEDDYDAIYDAVYTLMSTLQYVAIANPAHQDAIVTLLDTIKQLPTQTVPAPIVGGRRDSEREDTTWETESVAWADMRTFSAQLTDTYEYGFHLFTLSPSSEASISRWASINAFVARIASKWDPEYIFYLHRASCRFLRVLDVEGHPHFRGEVPAAADLFRYASPVLLRLCREEPPMPGVPIGIFNETPREHGEGTKVLWAGIGYSLYRWLWWKKRWSQTGSEGEFDDDVRAHARQALAAMKAAELER